MPFKKQCYLIFLMLSTAFTACAPAQPQGNNVSAPPEQNSAHDCIEQVLARDGELGKTRNHDCETISLSETIKKYTGGLAGLDFKDCPEAFAKAFQKHRQAWVEMIPLTDHFPDMRGEMHDLFDLIEKGEQAEVFKPLLKAIWDTWGEVEQAMEDAGVEVKEENG